MLVLSETEELPIWDISGVFLFASFEVPLVSGLFSGASESYSG
jgi:hypothetical protein